jgi:phenylacetate-CoA ligase
MKNSTMPFYVRKLNKFKPVYITGYAHTIYFLASFIEANGGLYFRPRALFTDSEGLKAENGVKLIESVFNAPCYDSYGLGEIGLLAIQCKEKTYHILELSCILECVDDDGCVLPDGKVGRLIATDLTQSAFPYIRYDTGDIGSLENTECSCGWTGRVLKHIEGRSDDYILTPDGRKLGRLSYITKKGKGILESQIAQVKKNKIIIRVIPSKNFDPESMESVLEVAKSLIGNQMSIEWQIVPHIKRSKMHKIQHVVREWNKGGR